jgi:hypothetical protein
MPVYFKENDRGFLGVKSFFEKKSPLFEKKSPLFAINQQY